MRTKIAGGVLVKPDTRIMVVLTWLKKNGSRTRTVRRGRGYFGLDPFFKLSKIFRAAHGMSEVLRKVVTTIPCAAKTPKKPAVF